ncbi:MAG: DUF1684 domain-containing protein [bacterium]|nr:DUF1684 domain-containing protein [bacterium]
MKRTTLLSLSVAGLLGVIVLVSGEPRSEERTNPYVASIEEWRAGRIERLKRPTGWFSLVGLDWLTEGKTTVGSDPSNDIVYAALLAPSRLGTFEYSGREVVFSVEKGVQVTHNGEAVTTIRMYADSDEDHELTVLVHGSLNFYVIERSSTFGIRAKDEKWAERVEFGGIPSYPVDERWKIEAKLVPHETPQVLSIIDVNDMKASRPTPGTLVFEIESRTYELTPIAAPGAEQLFIILGDETNGMETYAAGRFLYADAPDESGRVVLDFNKTYNPPCAFTDFATCPLPPRQNHLQVRITAGEKAYGDSQH